jgi:hypothetical protein
MAEKYTGKLDIVKQANGKFVVVDESGAVLHTKSATIGGKKSPAAPMEFKSKTQAAERLAEMRRDVRNMRFQIVEFTPGANAKGELPVTFDPKDTQAKKVKFLADEAYDKGYRVVERPDAPAAERYGFRDPDGVESKGFSTPRQAQDAMVKNRGTTPKYGKPPTFEGADYTPPKPEPAAKPEPVKVEPEPVKSTGTAKPPPEVAPIIDGPSRGIGAEAVVKGRNVELRLDGKVVSADAFNPNDKYYVTDGKRWVRASTLESARAVAGGSDTFKIIDVHQTNQAGAWSRLGAEAAEPALGHPLYEKGKPAPVVEPAPKPTPVTPESVVEDAVNKGKAARGEATIPVTEGTAMPKNPKPVGQGLEVIDRGAKGWQPGRRFVVQDTAGNILFEGKKADAVAALERMKKVPVSVLESTQGLNASMRGLRDIPVQTGTVVGSAETAARQQLIAQAAQAAPTRTSLLPPGFERVTQAVQTPPPLPPGMPIPVQPGAVPPPLPAGMAIPVQPGMNLPPVRRSLLPPGFQQVVQAVQTPPPLPAGTALPGYRGGALGAAVAPTPPPLSPGMAPLSPGMTPPPLPAGTPLPGYPGGALGAASFSNAPAVGAPSAATNAANQAILAATNKPVLSASGLSTGLGSSMPIP